MKYLGGRQVLITGAASGIGRSLALEFASEGCPLVLVDLDAAGLEEVAGRVAAYGVTAERHVVDVTDRSSLDALASNTSPDVLVNCAGIAIMAEIEKTTAEDWNRIIGVNLMGPINCVAAFLPGMKSRGDAHIVNVASAAGLSALPTLAAYSTTKFALVGYSEVLDAECAPHGIRVTTVCPGTVDTPILGSGKKGFDAGRVDRGLDLIKPLIFTSPEKLAKKIVSAVKKDRRIMTHTWLFHFLYYLKRLSPASVYWIQRMTYRVVRRTLSAQGDASVAKVPDPFATAGFFSSRSNER
ncbi:MAG: SDR family NAD(P)-dependent oxidoreductase [Actinobacteria bacterium]|nr:SDR family NAD(P)-dependent oxidoreductase [Actinomycetota bacterium]MBU1943749.1 SDR family NAD(P)-dependent oxidoreductase [Actinomycetota bacterium]MBU2688773.1 SDR family NAD(P)-dependent oxidoreductase [Actinomycetota bacterium]